MYLILILIGLSPGDMWFEACKSTEWANEYNYQLQAKNSESAYSGLLPDPILQFSFAGAPIETRNGPVTSSLRIQQKIPWPGFLTSSQNEAETAYLLVEETTNSLLLSKRTEIAVAWAEVYRHQQRIRILEQKATFLASLLASMSDYSTLPGIEQSVLFDLRIKSEMANQQPVSEGRLLEVSALELAAQTGIPINCKLSIPEYEWFIEIALGNSVNSPELQLAFASLQKSEAELARINSSIFPDFLLGVSYSFINEPEMLTGAIEPGKDSWMVSLGMNLPIGYSGNNYRTQQAKFKVMQAEAHYIQLELEVEAELLHQETLVVNTYDELQILNRMRPLSESSLQVASASWIAGRGSYSTLTTVLQSNLNLKLEIIEKEALLVSSTAKWLELAGAITIEGEFL